jgi:hypothetical protein
MKNAVFWDVDISEERRFTQYPHGATSQKTVFFSKREVYRARLLKG